MGRAAAADPNLQAVRAGHGPAAAAISEAMAQSLAARWPANMTVSLPGSPVNGYYNPPGAGLLEPITIDALAIRAEFGGFVALRLSCVRGNKDATLPLVLLLRMARLAAVWELQPPLEASPGANFPVTVLLVDADARSSESFEAAAAGSNASLQGGGLQAAADQRPARGAYANDFVTVCTLVPEAVFDSAGRPLNLSSVIVQGASSTAIAGIVAFPAVAITARVGATLRGRVDCITGSLRSPEPAPTWTIAMSACPRGSAPAGNGASCINCGRAYSDGGPAASTCITCPSVGAACSSGVLNLLPGFYRADANPTVDEHTELHPCALPFACWVNASTTNRSATETHGCNEGYTGVLCGVCAPGYARTGKKCGVCPPTAFNWFVTALLPAGVLVFGVWAAKRSVNEASPFAPLVRIGLGHVQLLGALMGAFIAQGTALVRELLGFAEVAGSSPLAIAPVHCALGGLTLYSRFFMTLALVPALMVATLSAQAVLFCCRRRKRRRDALRDRAAQRRAAATQAGAAAMRIAGAAASAAAVTLRGEFGAVESVANPLRLPSAYAMAGSGNVLSGSLQGGTASGADSAALGRTFSTQGGSTAVGGESSRVAAPSGCSFSSCWARLRRTIDDPRITGPAAFVLVSPSRRLISCAHQ